MQSSSSKRLILDRYRVVKKLGTGGMGDVYEAIDVETDEHVALKTVVVEKLSDATRVRLEREAEALSRFSHENIVGFRALKTHARMIYCIMELIDGEALAKRIERVWRLEKGHIPVETIEAVALGISSALQHAHEHAVLHRDIKPDNILLASTGRPVLTDFGLAKVKDLFSVTQAGQALGTVSYFAPEQMRGEATDERTDIYQLGLTLYETATGKLPFADEGMLAAMKRRIREPIPPPSELNEDIPPYLCRAIQRCLQPRAAARFASMLEMLDVLTAKETISLPPFRSGTKSQERKRPSRQSRPVTGAPCSARQQLPAAQSIQQAQTTSLMTVFELLTSPAAVLGIAAALLLVIVIIVIF